MPFCLCKTLAIHYNNVLCRHSFYYPVLYYFGEQLMNQYGTHDDNIDRTGSIADISDVVGTEEIRIEGRALKY